MNNTTRPDYLYWKSNRKARKEFDIDKLHEDLRAYSLGRFRLGEKFILSRDYYGILKGSRCTVVNVWPNTEVKWLVGDKAYSGKTTTLSYELDLVLVPVRRLI